MRQQQHRATILSRLRGTPTCARCGHASPCPAALLAQPRKPIPIDVLPRPDAAQMRRAVAEWRRNGGQHW